MHTYISSLDRLSTIVSRSIIALSLILFCVHYFIYKHSGEQPILLIAPALTPVILTILSIAMYNLKPLSVTIGNDAIIINRKWKPVTINFSEINSIRIVEKEEMKGVIRTFGNGGLYGYTGMYYNKIMGSMRWYCTQRCNYILIQTRGKKTIITPDLPNEFMNDIKSVEHRFLGNR